MVDYDVVIIGGGPAGAATAYTLAMAGLRVLLADDRAGVQTNIIGESLISAARPLLSKMGLLPWVLQSEPRSNFGNLSAWGSEEVVATDFISDPNGHGWHLDRVRFDLSLRLAAQHAGALLFSERITEIEWMQHYWELSTKDKIIKTKWIVDASGRRALLSRRLGITRYKDEPLISLYCWGVDGSRDARTMVEAVPNGWWYSAPLPQGRRVAALHVLPDEASYIMRHQNEWMDQLSLTRHIREFCSLDGQWSKVQASNAAGQWQYETSGKGWIAVGDAALAFDPLSSQGIFNALYTGYRGGQAVVAALSGDTGKLIQYSYQLRQVRQIYRRKVKEYYRYERRWRDSLFWKAR